MRMDQYSVLNDTARPYYEISSTRTLYSYEAELFDFQAAPILQAQLIKKEIKTSPELTWEVLPPKTSHDSFMADMY